MSENFKNTIFSMIIDNKELHKVSKPHNNRQHTATAISTRLYLTSNTFHRQYHVPRVKKQYIVKRPENTTTTTTQTTKQYMENARATTQ